MPFAARTGMQNWISSDIEMRRGWSDTVGVLMKSQGSETNPPTSHDRASSSLVVIEGGFLNNTLSSYLPYWFKSAI